jgi:hypothetical protein
LVRLLLEHGADIDARDHSGWLALYTSVSYDQPRAVQLLLERSANLEVAGIPELRLVVDMAGFWSFSGAMCHIIRTLLEHGEDPDTMF